MIIELIREERMRNFPLDNYSSSADDYFHLHCSHVFANALKQEFTVLCQRSGFTTIVDRTDEEPDITTKFTRYQIPNIGLVNVIEDMEQGYRIERIGNLKQ